jgi:hypothetical protein
MSGLFEMAMTAAAAISAGNAGTTPLQLQVRHEGGATLVQVVAHAAPPRLVGYALEVSDRSGGNRSVQRGNVRLQPNSESIITTVRLNSSHANVTAKLDVTLEGGAAYSQAFNASM